MKKMVIGFVSVIIITLILTSCVQKNKNKIKFDKESVPYSKEEISDYTYKIEGDSLGIKNDCGNLKIEKSNVDKVKIRMEKLVGGKSEDKLQDVLDSMNCTLENGVVNINSTWKDNSAVNSINIETTIIVPSSIQSISIENNIGDINIAGNYDALKIDIENGEISYTGNLKKGSIFSKIGNVNLNLQNLNSDYSYDIHGEVVNAKIKIPKGIKIKAIGSMAEKVKIKDGINVDEDGAIFDINAKVGNINIEN